MMSIESQIINTGTMFLFEKRTTKQMKIFNSNDITIYNNNNI